MSMHSSGKLYATFDAQQVTQRFRKREFVLEIADNPDYPQYVLFQLTGDRCEKLDEFSVGDQIEIEFNLRGREWTSPQGETKYFNSLDVWKVSKAGPAAFESDEPSFSEDDAFMKDVPF